MAAIAGMWLVACGEAPGPNETVSARVAPGFSLVAMSGDEVSLAQFLGRPVVIDFWATWCTPCIHQIPILNAFHADHGDDVPVLGITLDTDPQLVRDFAKEHEIAYQVLFGRPALPSRYGAIGFPTLYVVDASGKIAFEHVGIVDRQVLEEAVERAGRLRPSPGVAQATPAGGR